MNFQEGEILCFDKPYTWTSFNLVAKVRRELCHKLGIRKLKVGHAGTLDPLATGVMIVCTGKCTKRIAALQEGTKEYVATLQLGASTPSFDMEKEVDATYPTAHITLEGIRQVLTSFTGRIEQVPPSFSACKVDGKRAYDLARRGKEVQLKPKVLVIDELDIVDFSKEEMLLTIRVVCSKGTYIRALARDIGTALGSGAYLTSLRRTRVGEVRVEDCIRMDDFALWLERQETEYLPTDQEEQKK